MPTKKTPSSRAARVSKRIPVAAVPTVHAKPLEPRHFELRDDGTIWKTHSETTSAARNKPAKNHDAGPNAVPSPLASAAGTEGQGEISPKEFAHSTHEPKRSFVVTNNLPTVPPLPAGEGRGEGESFERECHAVHGEVRASGKGGRSTVQEIPNLIFKSDNPFLRLYHGDCFQLLDAIAAKHPQGRFDAIFADPPYFLSNGGITCHAGRMVKVDKGDWDKSRGPELNHEFNREWLARCQRVLKPNGTIWVSGTHHVIFSIGYAMQQLGFKILNDIAWEKPNPPPNLSCRYFTHSTETILWAARDEKSKHVFNYDAMRAVTGKQMKTVWRAKEFQPQMDTDEHRLNSSESSGESEILFHLPRS